MAEPSGSSEALAAGPAIARTIELSARLTILTARTVGRADLAQRARAVAERAAPLAAQDAEAYSEFLATRSAESQQLTIDLPLQMAELAADAAELAADAAAATEGAAVGGDARVGTLLAEAAARAAGLLVQLNGGGDAAAPATSRAARAAGRE
jgi:methenyltetrahydrofolate cyclohydrolase